MNDIFQCGDSAALVAYLYDECAPGEQALIAFTMLIEPDAGSTSCESAMLTLTTPI